MSTSHGCLYNKRYFDWFIAKYRAKFTIACDEVWNDTDVIKYKYANPICFQIFTATENKKNWSSGPLDAVFSLLRLDKSHKSFYTINAFCNVVSKYLPN